MFRIDAATDDLPLKRGFYVASDTACGNAFNAAKSLGQSVDDRRARERDLIAGYYQGLLDGGVTGYSMADLEDDIRIGLLINQMIMTVASTDTDITVIERECGDLGLDWRDVVLGAAKRRSRTGTFFP